MDGMTQRTINNVPKGMRPGRRELNEASLRVQLCEAVPEHMRASVREITHVHVAPEYRRKRLATMLLNLVCQEADANRMTRLLTAAPAWDSDMDAAQLVAFYELFGFVQLQDTPQGMLMARQVHERPRLSLVPLAVKVGTRNLELVH